MTQNRKAAEVETRKSEVRLITNKPEEMQGKYLARRLLRTWEENFVDEDTAEVVTIERNEIIMDAGKFIDGDELAQIRFYMESGDVTEVEVSNQRRNAVLAYSSHYWPYSVTAEIGGKKRRFLLYATSVLNALEITQDYIELNFEGYFAFKQVKAFDYCIFLQDFTAKSSNDPGADKKEFYKIEIEVLTEDDMVTPYTFVLSTRDVDTGMIVINDWLAKSIREHAEKQGYEEMAFSTTIKSGIIIPCFRIIEKEFSDAYIAPIAGQQSI